jgi:putative colanic acid biosynthesis acetyltransferase WcaF
MTLVGAPHAAELPVLLALIELRQPAQSTRERLWNLIGTRVFRLTFHNWYGLRRGVLRLFGSSVHPTARIRPSAMIFRPQNLAIGEESSIGDHAIINCIASITIGDRCTISQYAHLCSAGNDYTRRTRPLIARPIIIEDEAWISTDVFIAAGVTVGRGTVVGARATVFASLPPQTICTGDAAHPIAARQIRRQPAAGPESPAT